MSKNSPKMHSIKPYSKNAIDLCLDDIRTGRMSCYAASKRFGIPMSTLRYRLSGRWKQTSTPGPNTVLSPAEEQEVVDWLVDMQNRGFFMTRTECIWKVTNYLAARGRETAFKHSQPGRKWCDLFLRRNPSFTPSKVTTTVSADHIRNWFQNVYTWFTKNDLLQVLQDPTRVFILEEGSFNFPLESAWPSSSTEGATPAYLAVMFSFGASGLVVPPSIILPANCAALGFVMRDLPDGWGVQSCDPASMNTQNFRNHILHVFHPFLVKQGVQFPVVYFVDGLALSQVAEVDDMCQSLGIFLISAYRTTHTKPTTQSAGLGMVKTLKTEWQMSVKNWCSENPGKMPSLQHATSILRRTMERGINTNAIHSGFWTSGLHPFNAEAVDYSEYPVQVPEVITQLEETVSTEPLFDDSSTLAEPEMEQDQVTISIDKIYEAYDLIDSQTRARIRGDIRSLTREERIIGFFYREFVQPYVHISDDDPLEDSAFCPTSAISDDLNIDEVTNVKSEPPFDCWGGDEAGEPVSSQSTEQFGAAFKKYPAKSNVSGQFDAPIVLERAAQNTSAESSIPNRDISFVNVPTIKQEHQEEESQESLIEPRPESNSFACHQPIEQYERAKTDLLELHELLFSWNLVDLVPYFKKQQLYVRVLKHLCPEMAVTLLKDSGLPLGAQVEFNYQWNKWINNLDSANGDASRSSSVTRLPNPNEVPVNGSAATTSSSAQSTAKEKTINLSTILQSNQYGITLTNAYERKKVMSDNLRKLLVESVLQYCIEHKHELSVKDCSLLAGQIVQAFPGEEMAYYHLERKNSPPLGKLYHKYRNWKTGLNRKSAGAVPKPVAIKDSPKLYPVKDDEEAHIQALRYQLSIMSYGEKMTHWAGCVATRLNALRQKSIDFKQFFETWPHYKMPDGYRMIESDFTYMYGTKNGLLDCLDTFVELMIGDILPKHAIAFKTSEDVEMWAVLTKRKNELSKNSSAAMMFRLLQAVLPYSRIKVQKPTDPKRRFYSLTESKDAFIAVCPSETEFMKRYHEQIRQASPVPSYNMTLIGTLEQCQSVMVNLDGIAYKLHSIAEAIDVCFKAFHVFNVQYPEKCETMWDLLNREFYHLEQQTANTKPSTFALLSEIKAAKTARYAGNLELPPAGMSAS